MILTTFVGFMNDYLGVALQCNPKKVLHKTEQPLAVPHLISNLAPRFPLNLFRSSKGYRFNP